MKDYQIRVVEERDELHKKICRLDMFIHSGVFANLENKVEQDNLIFQLDVMRLYCKILEARISCFN